MYFQIFIQHRYWHLSLSLYSRTGNDALGWTIGSEHFINPAGP